MLLEKQIPWLVLDTLMDFLRSANVGLRNFVAYLGHEFFPKEYKVGWWSRILTIVCGCATGQRGNITKLKRDNNGGHSYESYRPAHLLGLLRFSQIWQMPEEEMNYAAANTLMTSSSAVELAQIGVKLTARTAAWFGDMRVQKSALFGEFFAVAGVPERRDRLLAGEHGSPGGGDRVGERHRRARGELDRTCRCWRCWWTGRRTCISCVSIAWCSPSATRRRWTSSNASRPAPQLGRPLLRRVGAARGVPAVEPADAELPQ